MTVHIRISASGLLLLFLLPTCSFGDQASEIETLIQKLGSRSYEDREAASKRLEGIGEPALEQLRKAATANHDPEIRRRAALLLPPEWVERFGEIFVPPRMPSIKGKAWVAVETGPVNCSEDLRGWLIKDRPMDILLLDSYAELHALRKPTQEEKRPRLKANDGRLSIVDIWEADRSVAWKWRVEDYTTQSKKFLTDGMLKEPKNDTRAMIYYRQFELADHVVDAARHAYFSFQLGHRADATQLYAHASKALKKYEDSHRPFVAGTLQLFVADRLASDLRSKAVFSGHNGVSRMELQKKWERIAAIPHQQYGDEAKTMAKSYQSLLDEDGRWVEPDMAAVAKMTTEQKVTYWLYHLRDLDVGQNSDPGWCYILARFDFPSGEGRKRKAHAAVELKALGIGAVPQLIAHLEDARPTRCKGHFRSYWPDGHYLLRYGDCCQQIFESITGYRIFEQQPDGSCYPIQNRQGKECKVKAEKWWQEYQAKKPER
jgi:hypothetical protein